MRVERGILFAILLTAGVAIVGASERRSVTFDELTFVGTGARGVRVGQWDMGPGHPPLAEYAYGLATLPLELNMPSEENGWTVSKRYIYSRLLFARLGNDPQTLIRLPRLLATLCALVLILAVWGFLRGRAPPGVALFGAVLVAFLPDVLAHGGIAYNDMPLATAFFLGVWALDAAIRAPTPARGALAGLACGVALGVKYTAGILLPLAAVLLLAEWFARGDRDWLRKVLPAGVACLLTIYAVLVAVGRGDILLESYAAGIQQIAGFAASGQGKPAYLLGETGTGWWYYFPVALSFKTPLGFQALLLLSLVGFFGGRADKDGLLHTLVGGPLRAPFAALILFGVGLLSSKMNIGTRHALPVLPLLAVLAAYGAARLWSRSAGGRRALVAVAALASVVSATSAYPHFLAYTSEHVRDDAGYTALADSSLDWGQGLLDLEAFMEEEGIDRVSLAYFGSMPPAGYGIKAMPLPGFAPPSFPVEPMDGPPPKWIVISATHLVGLHLPGDLYAAFREKTPDRILGHTLFVYKVE